MNVQRTGPSGPHPEKREEKKIPDKDRFHKLMVVEEVSEADVDQRKKKKEKAQTEPNFKAASPYELDFTNSSKDIFGRASVEGIDPEYGSPEPSTVASPPSFNEAESKKLPTAQAFWQEQTTEISATKTEKEVEVKRKKEKKEKGPFAAVQGKEMGEKVKMRKDGVQEEEISLTPLMHAQEKEISTKKGGKREILEQEVQPPEKKEKKIPYRPIQGKGERKTEKKKKSSKANDIYPPIHTLNTGRKEKKMPDHPIQEKGKREGEKRETFEATGIYAPITILDIGEKGGEKKSPSPKEVEAPLQSQMQPFTSQIASQAQSLTTPVSSYIRPEVQHLFTQMVGTILIMTTPPGITQTEVVLNSSAFQHSVFFGSVITLQRYATAPDSFNIQLRGSTQAVDLFHQNIPNLVAAFENEKFNFKIGRIEATYSPERPLFRRKGSTQTKSDFGNETNK